MHVRGAREAKGMPPPPSKRNKGKMAKKVPGLCGKSEPASADGWVGSKALVLGNPTPFFTFGNFS